MFHKHHQQKPRFREKKKKDSNKNQFARYHQRQSHGLHPNKSVNSLLPNNSRQTPLSDHMIRQFRMTDGTTAVGLLFSTGV